MIQSFNSLGLNICCHRRRTVRGQFQHVVHGFHHFLLCRCLVPMREIARTDVTDGVSWYCPHCKSQKSIRDGSFFSKSHITLQKWMILIHYWIAQESVTSAARSSGTSMVTAIKVYQWLREVCLLEPTYVYTSLPMFAPVYLCLFMFTSVDPCLQLSTHASLPMITHFYSCLPMFTLVYLCLPLFTRV